MSRVFGPRRAVWIDVRESDTDDLDESSLEHFTFFDLVYRSLCSVLYNFAQSGHPGGSISSGRIVECLFFDVMDYDIGDPNRTDADVLVYAAGHKALGLYALLALRDEVVRIGEPSALPNNRRLRLRLEDLLGFRRNPTHEGPLFRQFRAKPLDGHPTPATPFVKLATGASGVGVGSALGLAAAAADVYGHNAPRVHVIEGEGGLTPGRVNEVLAFAGATGLHNAVVHVDWNQSSIDSDAVTREGTTPGDYVQWDPMELFYLHDWNVVEVPAGQDLRCILKAQRRAEAIDNGQPTAVVYRTTKGWKYGIEGRKSHGAGHKLCSPEYRASLEPLLGDGAPGLPVCEGMCDILAADNALEHCYWQTLDLLRRILQDNYETCRALAGRVREASQRVRTRGRLPRDGAPDVERIYQATDIAQTPASLALEGGERVTLRQQLGCVLGHLNEASDGALLVGAADLLDSTSISGATRGFPGGFLDFRSNPESRTLAVGGICEDGLSCVLSGVSAFGHHVGAGASYGAFVAPLGHIASRLHAIGNQARQAVEEGPYRPMILVCGHAGLETGEDGPTHADPQALQLVQENFPPGMAVSLTPWDPREVWPLMATALRLRPAVIFPFVTRPKKLVLDREGLGLPPASAAGAGVYCLRDSWADEPDCTLVLQGASVAYEFVQDVLPRLAAYDLDIQVYYVASAELFDRLLPEEREHILPAVRGRRAMGITGFTLPTMHRWIRSSLGLAHTLHPFRKGRYMGSGPGRAVLHEAGLDAEAQIAGIRAYIDALARQNPTRPGSRV